MMVHGDFVKAIFKYHADIQPSSGIKLADPSGLAPAKLLPPIFIHSSLMETTQKLKLDPNCRWAMMHFF